MVVQRPIGDFKGQVLYAQDVDDELKSGGFCKFAHCRQALYFALSLGNAAPHLKDANRRKHVCIVSRSVFSPAHKFLANGLWILRYCAHSSAIFFHYIHGKKMMACKCFDGVDACKERRKHSTSKVVYIEIKKSTFKTAGLGLFVTKTHKPGDFIAYYGGCWKTKGDGPYLFQIKKGVLVDGTPGTICASPPAVAYRCNHAALNSKRNNAELFISRPKNKCPQPAIRATKTINPGEEVFISYGKSYIIRRFERE